MNGPVLYLGTHQPGWLWNPAVSVPLCVSDRRLGRYARLRPAQHSWFLDSGGFTELAMFGQWTADPLAYVMRVAEYDREIGNLDWAAPQDWMCEPMIRHGGVVKVNGKTVTIPGTHLSVREHQQRTVDSFLHLTELWSLYSDSECPFMPVLQGWEPGEYLECAALYATAGVRLDEYPVVGLGSICRRDDTAPVVSLVRELTPWLALHGFGVKTKGMHANAGRFTSVDSLAWSLDARHSEPLPGHTHQSCANCLTWALQWLGRRERELSDNTRRGFQGDLFDREPCDLCGSVICLSVRPGEPDIDPAVFVPAAIYEAAA